MAVEQHVIKSLSDYVNHVCIATSKLRQDGAAINEVPLFRGQANINFSLLPSISRNREYISSITIFNEERNLIEMAKYKLPDVFRAELLPLELLALLQHYGIPTRLLDVTENALVALYFSCCSEFNSDGEVFIFRYNERSVATYPIVNAIADTYRFCRGTYSSLEFFYRDVLSQPYFLEQRDMLNIVHPNFSDGANWIAECCKTPLFVYAPTRSQRQRAQSGRYLLFPNKIEPYEFDKSKLAFTTIIDPISKDNDALIISRLIIPHDLKKSMLSLLTSFGISEASLFPDDINTVCKNIRESFEQKLIGNQKEV